MLGNIIGIFIVNLISFGLFFFAVPYLTGKEMGGISESGYYQIFLTRCGQIGFWFHKKIDWLTKKISDRLNLHPGTIWISMIDIASNVLLITTCNAIYNLLIVNCIDVDLSVFSIKPESSFAKLSNVWLILGIVSRFSEINSIGAFFVAIGSTFLSICFFLIITIIYFSVLFGILEHRLKELHPLTKEGCRSEKICKNLLAQEISLDSIQSMRTKLLQGIVSFFDTLVMVKNFWVGKSGWVFIYLMLMLSCIQAYSGQTPAIGNLIAEIVDGTGILDTLGSFIISFLLAKTAAYGCHKVYETLPAALQQKIDITSDQLNETVRQIRAKQKAWTEENDFIHAAANGIRLRWESRAHREPAQRKNTTKTEGRTHTSPTLTKMDFTRDDTRK